MDFPPYGISQLIKALWNVCSSFSQSLVLGHSSLWSLVGTGSCMAKLNLKMAAIDVRNCKKTQTQLFIPDHANRPLKQTWWHRFQYTSTPQVWLFCPHWGLGKFCTPLCLQSEIKNEITEILRNINRIDKDITIGWANLTSPSTTIILIPGVSW